MMMCETRPVDRFQELQLLATFCRKGLRVEYDSPRIVELKRANLRYRPDFVIRFQRISIIVEVDEDGHRGYPLDYEVNRVLSIWNAFDKRVIFLRVFIAKNDKLSAEQTQIVYSAIMANRYGKCATPNAPHMIFVFYPSELVTNIRNSKRGGNLELIHYTPEENTTTTVASIGGLECRRCGTRFEYKSQILRHLTSRKTVCEPLRNDISPQDLVKELEESSKKRYACVAPGCNKSYEYATNLSRHRSTCSFIKKMEAVDVDSITVD